LIGCPHGLNPAFTSPTRIVFEAPRGISVGVNPLLAASVVSHSDRYLLSEALARAIFSKMASALAVQM
jgi:hypothetical protein